MNNDMIHSSSQDMRKKTILPWIAALFSILSGLVLALYSIQLILTESIGRVIGVWNLFASLSYFLLAFLLIRRLENAYHYGLKLSLGNLVFFLGQIYIWQLIEPQMSEVENNISPLVAIFLLCSILMALAVYFCFRDLVHPLPIEEVPESKILLSQIEKLKNGEYPYNKFSNTDKGVRFVQTDSAQLNDDDLKLLLKIRREFIAHAKNTIRGHVKINIPAAGRGNVDLYIKPWQSYLPFMFNGNSDNDKSYVFLPIVVDIEELTKWKNIGVKVIALTAPEEVIKRARGNIFRLQGTISLYLLKDMVFFGKKDNLFVHYLKKEYGITLTHYRK